MELLINLNISGLHTVEELVTNPDEKITVEAINTEEILAMINLNETTSQIKNESTDEEINLLLPTFDDYTKGLEWSYDLIRLLQNEQKIDKTALRQAHALNEYFKKRLDL